MAARARDHRKMTVMLSVRLPWWSSLYVWALDLMNDLGLVEIDPEIAADFIVRHSRFIVDPEIS